MAAYDDIIIPRRKLRPDEDVNAGTQLPRPTAAPAVAPPADGMAKPGWLAPKVPTTDYNQDVRENSLMARLQKGTQARQQAHFAALAARKATEQAALPPPARPASPIASAQAAPSPTAGPKVNVISPTRADFGTIRPPTRIPYDQPMAAGKAAASEAPAQAWKPPAMVPGMTTLSGTGNLPDSSAGPAARPLEQRMGSAAALESMAAEPQSGGYTIAGPARQSVASRRGAFGENVYDEASIERLTGKPIAQVREAAAASVPMGTAASSGVARPTFATGGAHGSVIANPDEDRRRLQIALDSVMARPARSRSARELQGELVQGVLGEHGQRQELAAGANAAQLEAGNRLALARMGQQGDNYRTELTEAGNNQRTLLSQTGETQRVQLALQRPDYQTAADGGLLQVTGTNAAAVVGADGKPVRMPQAVKADRFKEVMEAYGQQYGIAMSLPTPAEQQAELARINAGPIGQAREAMLAGINGGTDAPSAKPDYATFEKAVKAKNPGATPEEIKAFYADEYPN